MKALHDSIDELARTGDELYERTVRPRTTADDRGRFVAIDVQTGVFEIDADQLAAAHRVLADSPGAQLWFPRMGFDHVHRFGRRLPVENSFQPGPSPDRRAARAEAFAGRSVSAASAC